MEKEDHFQKVKQMIKNKQVQPMCFICGENDPLILKEEHHIDGKANSEDTIMLCPNCHAKITARQNMLLPKERSSKAPNRNKKKFQLVSLNALQEIITKKMGELVNEI